MTHIPYFYNPHSICCPRTWNNYSFLYRIRRRWAMEPPACDVGRSCRRWHHVQLCAHPCLAREGVCLKPRFQSRKCCLSVLFIFFFFISPERWWSRLVKTEVEGSLTAHPSPSLWSDVSLSKWAYKSINILTNFLIRLQRENLFSVTIFCAFLFDVCQTVIDLFLSPWHNFFLKVIWLRHRVVQILTSSI